MSKTQRTGRKGMPKALGHHHLGVHVSPEMKQRLNTLAEKYDRTTTDMIRVILRIGIPMMEGLSKAEEAMLRECVLIFRRLRQVRALKEI